MRLSILLALCLGLLAPAWAQLTLDATVGYNGFYRPRTLVPVTVHIRNSGGSVRGELRIVSDEFDRGTDRYVYPLTIAGKADQRRFFYFLPTHFMRDMRAEFWSRGRRIAMGKYTRCQEIYDQDRLMVVIGGSGSSLNYLNGESIMVPAMPKLRPWDYAHWQNVQSGYGYGYPRPMPPGGYSGPGSATSGSIHLTNLDPKLLPDNAEAYGSIDMLALMSTVTENTLSADAQRILPQWVSSGGHLIIAGGGVTSRLAAPFFSLLLGAGSSSEKTLAFPEGGKATIRRYGAGCVSTLSYDPDTPIAGAIKPVTKFYTNLLAREPREALSFLLSQALDESVMVRNLKPPNLAFIVVFLLVYLVLLVPVNYFVLRKLDRRELAWITIPAIVLLFTVGAYGVGYMSKGRRLVLNVATLVETTAGQRGAQAFSTALIFSPSRSTYRMDLGDTALLVRDQRASDDGSGRAGLAVERDGDRTVVSNVNVNMWDFRNFTLAHQVDLGQGITGSVLNSGNGVRKGTITNHSRINFTYCQLFYRGQQFAVFTLSPGQTVDLAKLTNTAFTPSFSADEAHIFAALSPKIDEQMRTRASDFGQAVLVGYTDAKLAPVSLNRLSTTTHLSVVVVTL